MFEFFKSWRLQEKRGKAPLKIAFVAPWYGENIGGGAEAVCRDLTKGIKRMMPEIEVQVITTALLEFAGDWNQNVHNEGAHLEHGLKVWRFNAETYTDRSHFDALNGTRLMVPGTADLWKDSVPQSPLTQEEETTYIKYMIGSHSMMAFLEKHRNSYDFFIFLPYMFSTTYHGIMTVGPKKTIAIPCLHDERYAYMKIYKEMMENLRGIIFNAKAEQRLAAKLYNIESKPQIYLGQMVDPSLATGQKQRFSEKYGIKTPFILYAGRKIVGKNLPLLVDYFSHMMRDCPERADLKLVIIGKGDLTYSQEEHPYIVDLGFVSVEDKMDAFAEALALCQPSTNESFSLVMMEAWLHETPCLVNAACEVTKDHCLDSGGGFAFNNPKEFQSQVRSLIEEQGLRQKMGKQGKTYVLENFAPESVIKRLVGFLQNLKSAG